MVEPGVTYTLMKQPWNNATNQYKLVNVASQEIKGVANTNYSGTIKYIAYHN